MNKAKRSFSLVVLAAGTLLWVCTGAIAKPNVIHYGGDAQFYFSKVNGNTSVSPESGSIDFVEPSQEPVMQGVPVHVPRASTPNFIQGTWNGMVLTNPLTPNQGSGNGHSERLPNLPATQPQQSNQ